MSNNIILYFFWMFVCRNMCIHSFIHSFIHYEHQVLFLTIPGNELDANDSVKQIKPLLCN